MDVFKFVLRALLHNNNRRQLYNIDLSNFLFPESLILLQISLYMYRLLSLIFICAFSDSFQGSLAFLLRQHAIHVTISSRILTNMSKVVNYVV